MIAVFTALKEERRAVQQALETTSAGTVRGFELQAGPGVLSLCSGIGAERVERVVELAAEVFNPSLYLLVGFSAGLRPELRVGDLVVDERSDPMILGRLRRLDLSYTEGKVATCGFLQTRADKANFATDHPHAPIADLESAAFLAALPEGASGLVVRAVSDEVDCELPLDFSTLCDDEGFPKVGSIALEVLRQPQLIKPMVGLANRAHQAVSKLESFLRRIRPLLDEEMETARE